MATVFFKKVNFGRGTLNAGITDVATSMTLDSGHTLPQTSGDFRVALYDSDTYPYPGDDINMEIVTANWSSGDIYDITRAQEGTSGVAHSASDRVANMITGGSLEELETAINARTERASAEIITGAWTFNGLFKWGDASLTNDYIVGVSELAADRTITLPALTGNDIFTFNDFAATLTNKTINTAANTITVVEADITDGSLLARMAGAEVITGAWRFDNIVWIQKTGIEALLVGKDSDGGNVLVADTTNSLITLGGVAPVIGCCLLLPSQNDAVTPTLAFGDGNTGFYEQSDNVLILSLAGVGSITFDAAWFFSTSNAAGWAIVDETPSATNPVYTFRGDTDTGFAKAGADIVALVAGAVSAIQYAEASSAIISTQQITTGITAFASGGQGSAVQLLSSINVVETVANPGDSVKLPVAAAGVEVVVINVAGADCDVFPSSGDSIDTLSVNLAQSLIADTSITYMARNSTNWRTVR